MRGQLLTFTQLKQARALEAAGADALRALETRHAALVDEADQLRSKYGEAQRQRELDQDQHVQNLQQKYKEWEDQEGLARREREMVWEHERGVERGLLQEELRLRKEELVAAREALGVLEMNIEKLAGETLEEVKRLEAELRRCCHAKVGVPLSIKTHPLSLSLFLPQPPLRPLSPPPPPLSLSL